MRTPKTSIAAVVAVLTFWCWAAMPARAQDGAAPRMPNGKPDLNGIWQRPYVPDMTKNGRGQKGEAELPFTPAGLADWNSYDAANGDYTGSCFPFGMMRSVNAPYPLQIIQNDTYVALLFEANTWFHVVPIDGRDHPKEPEPTWFGHSIGKWNGDTLVVDTVGFNGYTRLDTIGHPHSDALHMVQTFHRVNADRIEYTVTIDDPTMYTKPWKNERTFTPLHGELMEYSCEENNRSLWEGRIKAWVPPWIRKP
ncbi:MAG TPA: hypothetical protein VGQ16_01985 [Vicinamibacterales bacterium]|jgi:hypothetical protein|nr:hypothetical protein [Vicinamibacterales bacterium]